MTGIYYTDVLDVLRAAGCRVAESSTTNGWERRARSSGGFAAPPLGVQWHHTASSTSPANDLSWQIVGCQDAPVGNMLLDRTGCFWPVAAGAANTAGKGGPLTLSRGTIPADGANTRTWALEVANNGVGERWPVEQIDAYFAGSNALNARFGNLPTDVFSHALGGGEATGWTSRKIDPATAASVEGPWRPRSVNGSGTWSLADIRAECSRRSSSSPAPAPPDPSLPIGDDDMAYAVLQASDDPSGPFLWWTGGKLGAVRNLTQVDVGRACGLYVNSTSDPLRNFTKAELRDMIASGWDDAMPPPDGYG